MSNPKSFDTRLRETDVKERTLLERFCSFCYTIRVVEFIPKWD